MAANKLILLEIVYDQIHFLQMFADTMIDGSPQQKSMFFVWIQQWVGLPCNSY
jgi:hypothetical protein